MQAKIQKLKSAKQPKKVISFWANVALHQELIKEANRMGVSKSDAIRILLERGLQNVTH